MIVVTVRLTYSLSLFLPPSYFYDIPVTVIMMVNQTATVVVVTVVMVTVVVVMVVAVMVVVVMVGIVTVMVVTVVIVVTVQSCNLSTHAIQCLL